MANGWMYLTKPQIINITLRLKHAYMYICQEYHLHLNTQVDSLNPAIYCRCALYQPTYTYEFHTLIIQSV